MNDPKIKKEEEEKKLVPYGLLGGRTAAFGILKGKPAAQVSNRIDLRHG